MYSSEINDFLFYAGYKYQVAIQEDENTTDYHLILKHVVYGTFSSRDAGECPFLAHQGNLIGIIYEAID